MRRLTDQVSVDEMLKMREAGMTNQDIANSLNASVITVRRYIGTQPGNRSRRMETPAKGHGRARAGSRAGRIEPGDLS